MATTIKLLAGTSRVAIAILMQLFVEHLRVFDDDECEKEVGMVVYVLWWRMFGTGSNSHQASNQNDCACEILGYTA